MKKVIRISAISIAGIALIYFGLCGYVWYLDTQRNQNSSVLRSSVEQNNQVLGLLREKGCDYCHTPSAKLPFYASFPVAKQLMEYDIRLGYSSFSLEPVRSALIKDKPPTQSDLNKIEWVMQHKTMPPTRYVALHWAGQISPQERETLLTWIAQQRARYYASTDAAKQHRNEPIQPIPKGLPVDGQKVALGFRLYHDPRLSGDSTLSCAHCHSLNTGGVDGRKTSIGVGGAVGPINAP
ncbi:heme-binding domain-containing protein, partial [Serratia proteamaculans]